MGAPLGNHNHMKHNGVHTRLYNIWKTMRQRCFNKNNQKYEYYGGKGVSICAEWNDFSNFREWAISNGYNEDLTLDRIDVNGNYEPANCRWVTHQIQANNKSNNKIIVYNSKQMTMADFCREYNLNYRLFSKYLIKGLSISDAMVKSTKR